MELRKMLPTFGLLLASAYLLNSCASTPLRPATPGEELNVVILPATHVQVVQTSARQDGGEVIVSGQVQRKKAHGKVVPKGHVDIAIVDVKGKTIQQIPVRCSPEIIPRLDGLKSSFMARIPCTAPPGSFITIKFHSGSHDIVRNNSKNAWMAISG